MFFSVNKLSGTVPDFSALVNLQALRLRCVGAEVQNSSVHAPISRKSENVCFRHKKAHKSHRVVYRLARYAFGFARDKLKAIFSLPHTMRTFVNARHCIDHSLNLLSGTIPALASLTRLQRLYLWGNRLSGSVPAFAPLVQLQELALQACLSEE
jgi:hypothetical protein